MSSISLVFCVQIDYGSFSFNGWRLTLVDALDTMWIMDLRHEFYDAMPLVANMTFSARKVRFEDSKTDDSLTLWTE